MPSAACGCHSHTLLQAAWEVSPCPSCLGPGTSRVEEVGLLRGPVLQAGPRPHQVITPFKVGCLGRGSECGQGQTSLVAS